MARFVDEQLPEDLYRRLDGSNLEAHAEQAVLICTVDSKGWPHPAMLSYFEVIAKDRGNIRLATYSNSSTSDNMRRNGKLTVSVIDERLTYYIKGRAEELPSTMSCSPHTAKFNLHVEQVLADHADTQVEGDAYVTSGVTYRNPDPAAQLSKAKELLQELME